MNLQGATLWFTGIPASGKSSIARALYQRLYDLGHAVELLDGHEVHEALSRDVRQASPEGEEHVRRLAYVAKLLSRNGVIAICCSVSPHRAAREEVRRSVTNLIEVFVDCPVEVAEGRDRNNTRAQATREELENWASMSDLYEEPAAPEVHVHSDQESVEQGCWKVLRTLEMIGIIPASDEEERSTSEEEIRRRLAALGYI